MLGPIFNWGNSLECDYFASCNEAVLHGTVMDVFNESFLFVWWKRMDRHFIVKFRNELIWKVKKKMMTNFRISPLIHMYKKKYFLNLSWRIIS